MFDTLEEAERYAAPIEARGLVARIYRIVSRFSDLPPKFVVYVETLEQ